MTHTIIFTALAASFTMGFLFGDGRAVRRFNAVLDEHIRDLEKEILKADQPQAVDPDDMSERSTVH
jgi:hypothetical protein